MTSKPLKPRLLPTGSLVCPACGNLCETPHARHPKTGRVEKMVLCKGTAPCPHCPFVHEIDNEVARWHNAAWYAQDRCYAPGPLFDPVIPPPRIRIWTYTKATSAIPYLAPLVGGLRSAACRLSHLRLTGCKSRVPSRVLAADLGNAEGEVESLRDEVEAVGVLLHGGPLRGTILFPSFVHHSGSRPRGLYLVWRDSRASIETYATAGDLRHGSDLESCEKPLPKAWKSI